MSYIKKTGDTRATTGRKVAIDPGEVRIMISLMRSLGERLAEDLRRLP